MPAGPAPASLRAGLKCSVRAEGPPLLTKQNIKKEFPAGNSFFIMRRFYEESCSENCPPLLFPLYSLFTIYSYSLHYCVQ